MEENEFPTRVEYLQWRISSGIRYNPKEFPWKVCPEWDGRGGLAARREVMEALMKANGWDKASYSSNAYQEASYMLTRWERMEESDRILLCTKERQITANVLQSDDRPHELVFQREAPSVGAQESIKYRGDVGLALTDMWNSGVNPDLRASESEGIYILLNSAGHDPDGHEEKIAKTREYQVGVREAASVGRHGDDEVLQRSKYYVSGKKQGDRPTEVEVEKKVVKGRMNPRAEKIARMTYRDYRKTKGYMLAAGRNRSWAVALSTQLSRLCTREVVDLWAKQLLNSGLSRSKARSDANLLLSGIRSWSANTWELSQEKVTPCGEDGREDTSHEDAGISWFISGVASSDSLRETCIRNGVCPICLYFQARGCQSRDMSATSEMGATDDSLFKFDSGWAAAMAKIHNKEQHSLNGNITDRTLTDTRTTREALMSHDSRQGWDSTPVRCINRESWSEILKEAEKYSFHSFYSDSNHGGSSTYVSAGTLHQLAKGTLVEVHEDEFQEERNLDRDQAVAVRPRGRRGGYIRIGQPPAEALDVPNAPRGHHQTWIGIGADRAKHHGHIVMTDLGETMVRTLKDPEDKSGMINMNQSRTIFNYIVGGGGLAMASSMGKLSDWRELGLRVTLYDDLRERRFTQPSGVDWAIAQKQEVTTRYVPTQEHGWGFSACVVSWRYIDRHLQNNGSIPLGQENWDINSDEVVLIGIAQNSSEAGCGREAWILSHLDYPLLFGVDTFTVLTARANGGVTSREQEFVRTSSLVTLHSGARKILFVTNTDTQRSIILGGTRCTVAQVNRFGDPVAGNGPTIYPFDQAIDNMLYKIMNTTQCLREAFDNYASSYFPGGLDWMEVDNITAMLKVRWHNKAGVSIIEGDDGSPSDKTVRYLPSGLCRYIGLPARQDDDVVNYGDADATTSLDHIFVDLDTAQAKPAVRVGRWDAIAELGMVSGMCVYSAFNKENHEMVKGRIHAGGMDSLCRAGYWRRILETFKRQNGLRDEIASPGSYVLLGDYWTSFVEPSVVGGATLGLISGLVCKTEYCCWSWTMNEERTINPSITGSRTPSSWWRCEVNETFRAFQMGGGANHAVYDYTLNTSRTEWSYNMWQPQDRGEDDYQLEAVLNRLNLESIGYEGVEYMMLPSRDRSSSYGYCIETLATGRLARSGGWRDAYQKLDNNLVKKRWSWGLNVVIRDWTKDSIKKICLKASVGSLVESGYFLEGLQLFRGPETQPVSGSGRDYIYRPSVTDWTAIQGNLQTGSALPSSAAPVSGTPKVPSHGHGNTISGWKDDSVPGGKGVPAEPTLPLKREIVGKTLELGRTGASVRTIHPTSLEHGASTREAVGGLVTETSPAGLGIPTVKELKEKKRVMVTGEHEPKLGTSAEDAATNPDHRKRQDET
ncbi:MAG: putative capsid protein [Corcyphos virus 1]|nr:MAG: putative capsid protein [Corcyphos virus 1]